MKKILILLAAILCFGINSVYADGTKTCKVNGTTGSVEVSVYSVDTDKGTAMVTFSNDTDEYVNVRWEVKFYNGTGGEITSKTGSKLVPPHSEASPVELNINKSYSNVMVTSVSGEKCQ